MKWVAANESKANSLPSGTGSAGLTGGWRRPTVAKAVGAPGESLQRPAAALRTLMRKADT